VHGFEGSLEFSAGGGAEPRGINGQEGVKRAESNETTGEIKLGHRWRRGVVEGMGGGGDADRNRQELIGEFRRAGAPGGGGPHPQKLPAGGGGARPTGDPRASLDELGPPAFAGKGMGWTVGGAAFAKGHRGGGKGGWGKQGKVYRRWGQGGARDVNTRPAAQRMDHNFQSVDFFMASHVLVPGSRTR